MGYMLSPDGRKLLGYDGSDPFPVLPQEIEEIGDSAFLGSSVCEITIPGTVRRIGAFAFHACEALTRVVIEAGVEQIDEQAFSECPCLREILLPDSVAEIGCCAFMLCENLRHIHLPAGIKRIDDSTFDSASLDDVIIPEGVTDIGDFAFGNNGLRSVSLPSTLKSIGQYAFNQNGLTSIQLPDSLKSIDMFAFGNNPEELQKSFRQTDKWDDSIFFDDENDPRRFEEDEN